MSAHIPDGDKLRPYYMFLPDEIVVKICKYLDVTFYLYTVTS